MMSKNIILKPLFLFLAVFTLLIIFPSKSYASCMTITGSVQLTSGVWPAGYDGLQLACGADNPPGPSNCTGDSQIVGPGESFTFTKCSCLASPCLSIAGVSVPPGCTFTSGTSFCGSNGGTVDAQIRMSCPLPAAPCPPPGVKGGCGPSTGSGVCASNEDPIYVGDGSSRNDWCASQPNGSQNPYCFTCQPKPTATRTPTPSPTRTPTQSPTSGPSCNTPCSTPSACTGAIDGCTYCNPTTNRCTVPPTNVPPTSGPSCNTPCSTPSACTGAIDGCTYCNPTTNRCTIPPTPGPGCNTPCSSPATCTGAIDGCTYCNPTTNRCDFPPSGPTNTPTPTNTPRPTNTPTATATPGPQCGEPCNPTNNRCPVACPVCTPGAGGGTPICQTAPTATPSPTATPRPTNTPTATPTFTPTPTPDFNEDMCKCDGTDINWVVAGAPTKVTQWAKVEGTDVGKAIVESVDFTIYKGDNTSGQIILGPEKVPATLDSQTATLTRYKSEWNFTMPNTFVAGDVYRIQGKIKCVPGPRAYTGTRLASSYVQQGSAENTGFFGGILNFFGGLFGGGSDTQTTSTQQSTQQVGPTRDPDRRDVPQLETFTPGNAFFKTCNWLLFKFDAPTQ